MKKINKKQIITLFLAVIFAVLPLSAQMHVSSNDGKFIANPPLINQTFNVANFLISYGSLVSCQNFTAQKYIDITNYVAIASFYENYPVAGTYNLFKYLNEQQQVAPQEYRIGYAKTADISKKRSKNLFHEVIYHISKVAEHTGNGVKMPHIRNGLYLKYDNVPYLPGGVDVYNSSGTSTNKITEVFANSNTVCMCENPEETPLYSAPCTACNNISGATIHSIASYRQSFYTTFSGGGNSSPDLTIPENRFKIVQGLQDQLLRLLIQRANIEVTWQERKEEILSIHPEDADIYGVADIKQSSLELLRKLTPFREVGEIRRLEDITDGDILREYDNRSKEADENYYRNQAIKEARIKRFEELQAKLTDTVRTTRFTETEEAEKLWNQHFMNTRYYLDSFSNDMRGSTDQDVRKQWYPNGETEYLIETVLSQIDERIAKILLAVTGTTIGSMEVPDCIGTSSSNDDQLVCDYDPAWFMKAVGGIVSPGEMETSYKECVSITKNDPNAFRDSINYYSPGWLATVPNLWVFEPSEGWDKVGEVLQAVADDSKNDLNTSDNDLESILKTMEKILQEYQRWKKEYKKDNNTLSSDNIQTYFHFGDQLWEYYPKNEYDPSEGYEQKYIKYSGDDDEGEPYTGTGEGENAEKTRYDSNTSLKSKFETCFGLQGGGGVTMNALSNSSNDDSKYWECFETWIDANTLYMEEVQAIQSRMAILESDYRLLKARIAARKLKKSGMLNPEISADGETNNNSGQTRNPFGIPSSLEKWYSNYMQFGVDDLNANFNFIAGLGIKNIVLDPNAYNPIEYLRNGEAFIPQLGKAMLKYADESGYDNALKENPHQVEIAAVLLGHKMMLNLKNINKFSKMYEEVFSTIHQFDPDKIRALFSGRALKNLVDEEKVIEILAQELAFEIMTRMSLQNDGNAVPPYTVLQALMRGSNFWLNEHERTKECNNDKESCLEALQEIEEIRTKAESLVRAWEGAIQENANIIRNELKKLYGQQGAFYHLIDSMVHSGNPLKGLNSSSNTDANEILFDMLVDAALNRAVGDTRITFTCGTANIYIETSGQGVDNLAKNLKNCSSLSVKIGNSSNPIDFSSLSSGNIQLLMEIVVDFKSLLKTAAPEIALDYILTTFKIDAKERDSIKGQIKPALNQVKNVYCLPKIDGNANLKCADNDSLNISNLIVSSGNSGVPLSLNTVLTRAVREIIGDNGTNSVTPNQITQLENIARKYTNDENLIKVIVPVTIVTAYMQKFINNQIINREAAISSVQNAIGGALSSSSNEIFQNLDLCNDQNNLSDPEKCSINTFMRSISTIGSNLKGDNAMPDLVNDTTGCVACDSIATTIKNILSDTTTGNLHDNLNLITQHDIPAFNLQSSDLNFDPVINFGRVKGSFTDKFMRLAESSMATTYSYTSPVNQNEQDITDTSFWQGLIGQMIIPELTGSAKAKLISLQTELAKFDQNDSSSNVSNEYGNLLEEINPFTFSAVGYNTVETVATYISDILSDGDLFIRVIKRLTDEIGIISTFKELMNGVKSEINSVQHDSAIDWLLEEIDPLDLEGTINPDDPRLIDNFICQIANINSNSCGFAHLKEKLLEDGTVNLSQLLATAIAMRVEEIFMHELLKIPYGEVCTHVYSGLHLFTFDADLFETTFYVTTRLQKDRYGRLIDLEHVNPKSKEAFARKYEGKVETFKPYTKYYFFAQNISFDDLAASAIEKGKEAMEGLVKKGVEAASDKIEEKLAKYADEVDDPDTFKENFAKDPKLEDLEFANIEKGGTVNFQIGPVPAYLSFGMVFRAGLRYGVDYNAAWFRGLTLGASAGPYLVVGAYLEAGIGFDYSWISFKIGVGGSIDVFEFYAPLKVQGLLKPAMDFNGLNMKFYLTTSLEPEIYLLAGKIYVKASGKIGIDPFAIGFSVKKTIFDWDPLIKKKFGNIIPLKPIELDLFSIGRGMKVLGNDVSTF